MINLIDRHWGLQYLGQIALENWSPSQLAVFFLCLKNVILIFVVASRPIMRLSWQLQYFWLLGQQKVSTDLYKSIVFISLFTYKCWKLKVVNFDKRANRILDLDWVKLHLHVLYSWTSPLYSYDQWILMEMTINNHWPLDIFSYCRRINRRIVSPL